LVCGRMENEKPVAREVVSRELGGALDPLCLSAGAAQAHLHEQIDRGLTAAYEKGYQRLHFLVDSLLKN